MKWDEISQELQKKLNPAAVRPPPRGKFGSYVDAYHVITEANRIFGEGGWSYEITRLSLVSEQTVPITKNNEKVNQFRVGYMATVRVTVGDVYREGAAVGSGVGSSATEADHHESAIKEAETDALKRALRSFGNTFGLALYDKINPGANIGVETDPSEMRDRLLAAIKKCSTADMVNTFWGQETTSKAIAGLPSVMAETVKKAKAEKQDALDKRIAEKPDEGIDDDKKFLEGN